MALLAPQGSRAQSPLPGAEPPPVGEKAAVEVTELIHRYKTDGLAGPDLPLLERAAELYRAGRTSDARAAVAIFATRHDAAIQALAQGQADRTHSRGLVSYGIDRKTRDVARQAAGLVLTLGQIPYEALSAALDVEKQGWIETGLRMLSPRRNRMLSESAARIDAALIRLASHLREADAPRIRQFRREGDRFLARLTEAVDAIGNRWASSELHAAYLERAVRQFVEKGRFSLERDQELALRTEIIEREKAETYLREVYINRETVGAAIAVATLGYGGFVRLAGQAAGKAALGVIFRKGAETGLRLAAGVMAAGNLSDILRFKGAKGLASFAGALDLLTLVAILPRPAAEAMKASRALQQVGMLQHQAGYLALAVGTGYGGYLIAKAPELARLCEQMGDPSCSESQFRSQGYAAVLTGLLGGWISYREYKKGLASSPEYERLMKDATAGPTIRKLRAQLSRLLIWNPVRDAVSNVRDIRDARALARSPAPASASAAPAARSQPLPPTATAAALPARTIPTVGASARALLSNLQGALFDVMAYHALAMIAYTYPDFLFERAADPLPALGPGEIAVALNGFDPSDMLHAIFDGEQALKRELLQYERGKNFFTADFDSAEGLVERIRELSKKGRIRYLRIGTHGLPGSLVTRGTYSFDSLNGQQTGSIDERWLLSNEKRLRRISREAFAPGAQIRIAACLAGATLRKEIRNDLVRIPRDAGDRLVRALGRTLLVNGGEIHTSRRYLVYVEAEAGAAARVLMKGGILPDEAAARLRDAIEGQVDATIAESQDSPRRMLELVSLRHRIDRLLAPLPAPPLAAGAAGSPGQPAGARHAGGLRPGQIPPELDPTIQHPRSGSSGTDRDPDRSRAASGSGGSAAGSDDPEGKPTLKLILARSTGLLKNAYEIVNDYGINLDHGYFGHHHRVDRFAPSPD